MAANTSVGGYDLNWLEDPPDDLKCLICLCVARDPHQHPGDASNECGKVFCHGCITEHQRNNKTCPNCEKDLTNYFKDAKSKYIHNYISIYINSIGAQQIRSLRLECDNLKNGCEWTGELGDVDKHRCEYKPVSCKYAEVGCKVRPLRKDIKKHEEDVQVHLQIMADKVLELTKVNSKSTSTLPRTIRLTSYLKHKSDKDPFYSPPFYTSYTGYKMCLRVDVNGWGAGEGTHVSAGAVLMKGDNDDSLSWPFTGTITFELLNQLEDKNHHKWKNTFPANEKSSQRVVDGERAPHGSGTSQVILHTDLDYNAYQNTQYLKDDTLVFRVSVQVPDYKPWLN